MFTVVLYRPEIPPNTGNIGRLTLGTGSNLVIVGKPGFELTEEAAVKRAGLDYWDKVRPVCYPTWAEYCRAPVNNRYLLTKFSSKAYYQPDYCEGDHLIFGGETRGVPESIHSDPSVQPICLPMCNKIRAYNLANSVSAVLFEALRQVLPGWFTSTPYSPD